MTVTINGGTIEATANRNNAASDKGKGESGVTITDGVIHAAGKGSAAGIGSMGDIRITGGELTVSAEGSGAAIGGFTDSYSERVRLPKAYTNGDVNPFPAKDGACIGDAGGSVGSSPFRTQSFHLSAPKSSDRLGRRLAGWKLTICYESAWYLLHQIRRAMAQRDENYALSGIVESDDGYVADQQKKTVADGQGEDRGGAVKNGEWRGFVHGCRLLKMSPAARSSRSVDEAVAPGSKVKCDGHRSYRNRTESITLDGENVRTRRICIGCKKPSVNLKAFLLGHLSRPLHAASGAFSYPALSSGTYSGKQQNDRREQPSAVL